MKRIIKTTTIIEEDILTDDGIKTSRGKKTTISTVEEEGIFYEESESKRWEGIENRKL